MREENALELFRKMPLLNIRNGLGVLTNVQWIGKILEDVSVGKASMEIEKPDEVSVMGVDELEDHKIKQLISQGFEHNKFDYLHLALSEVKIIVIPENSRSTIRIKRSSIANTFSHLVIIDRKSVV